MSQTIIYRTFLALDDL